MYRYCGFLLLALSSQVHAWGFTGHKAFCEAAYDLTSATTQKALDAIAAKQGTYHSFAEACTWADDIKKDHQWDWSKHLHYINVSRSETTLHDADCNKGCVLSAIAEQEAKLQQDPQNWQALFFLAHFVGDLHQPLHVSYADDWGGNKTQVTFFGEPANLHGVFDFGIIEHMVGDDWKDFGDHLAKLANKDDANGTPEQWGDESLALTREIYAGYQPHEILGQPYVEQYGPLIEQQIEKGAVRLAKILDQIYNP